MEDDERMDADCSRCEKTNPADASYCRRCGLDLHPGQTPAAAHSSPEPDQRPVEYTLLGHMGRQMKRSIIGVGLAAVAIPLMLYVGTPIDVVVAGLLAGAKALAFAVLGWPLFSWTVIKVGGWAGIR